MKVYTYVDKTRANADGSFPVYLIVKYKGGRFFVNTGMVTCDRLTDGIVFPKADTQARQKMVVLGNYLAKTEKVCLQQELLGSDVTTIKAEIQRQVFNIVPKSASLAECIAQFAKTKKPSTAILYSITERKVREYNSNIEPSAIDGNWLESFRQSCIDSGMTINGAGKELRNIRAVFNWLRRNKKVTSYPFLDYHIPEEETIPNDLSAEDIRRLRDYPCEDWQKRYVDFFMLSFYLAGINPGDLLLMKKSAVKDNHISFVRRKTDKDGVKVIRTIVLPLVDEAWEIIKRYPSKEDYLLGFMDGRKDYHSFVKECNKALKKVGERKIKPDKAGKLRKVEYLPLYPEITLYTARYSFGSIAANDLDISEQTIGQCLGHSWSKHVTARYISHDQRKVDNAVKRVVDYVSHAHT